MVATAVRQGCLVAFGGSTPLCSGLQMVGSHNPDMEETSDGPILNRSTEDMFVLSKGNVVVCSPTQADTQVTLLALIRGPRHRRT